MGTRGELCFINYKSRATVSVTGGLMWHRSPPPHCSRVWGTWTPHVALSYRSSTPCTSVLDCSWLEVLSVVVQDYATLLAPSFIWL
jgi:hypothetical protein